MQNYFEFKDAAVAAELDLPDWSTSDASPRCLSAQAAFRLCERYAAEMPELVRRLRAERRQPCHVEFVL